MFYHYPNIIFLSITALLLNGCGNESTSTNIETLELGRSSEYSIEELIVYTEVLATPDGKLKATAYVQNKEFKNLRIDGTDKLLISVDGNEVTVQYNSNRYHTAEMPLVNYSSEISAILTRADQFIASRTINQLPLPFSPEPSYSNEVIALSWAPEIDVNYKLLGQTLICSNANSRLIQEALPTHNGLSRDISSGQYSATLTSAFGDSKEKLTADYNNCQIDMLITARLTNQSPTVEGSYNVILDSGTTHSVSVILK